MHGEPGLDLRPYQIVLRPLVTEKGTHQSTRYNAYAFQVNPSPPRPDQGRGRGVCSTSGSRRCGRMNRKGKKRRFRQSIGQLAPWKKAIVTLHTDDKIEFF